MPAGNPNMPGLREGSQAKCCVPKIRATTTGDGILMEFASVVDAGRCLVEVQRGMAVCNADFVPARRIEFRVGIHLGDVIVEPDGDLMGDGVNIAERLEAMAAPGGICLSRAAFRRQKGS